MNSLRKTNANEPNRQSIFYLNNVIPLLVVLPFAAPLLVGPRLVVPLPVVQLVALPLAGPAALPLVAPAVPRLVAPAAPRLVEPAELPAADEWPSAAPPPPWRRRLGMDEVSLAYPNGNMRFAVPPAGSPLLATPVLLKLAGTGPRRVDNALAATAAARQFHDSQNINLNHTMETKKTGRASLLDLIVTSKNVPSGKLSLERLRGTLTLKPFQYQIDKNIILVIVSLSNITTNRNFRYNHVLFFEGHPTVLNPYGVSYHMT